MERQKLLDQFEGKTRQRIVQWLDGPFDPVTKKEILNLCKNNPQEALNSFYTTLTFGTAGFRALMGPGPNRLNIYTIMFATQGLANWLHKIFQTKPCAVVIGYDCRRHSKQFAEMAASVLAGNGVEVFLFSSETGAPLVSFACRYRKCQAAIMVTGSHNGPFYNGFKIYWEDGGQVIVPHDRAILEEIQKIFDPTQVKVTELPHPLVQLINHEIEAAYLKAIEKWSLFPELCLSKGHELRILYSPLHGPGVTIVPEALRQAGFSQVGLVSEQKELNGDFPTVKTPNPEEKDALKMGLEQMAKESWDIFLATDSDVDRLGCCVNHKGLPVVLSGNQLGAICVDAICSAMAKEELAKAAFVKTIVTTPLFSKICAHYGAASFDVLPGFKYVAEKMRLWEKNPQGLQFVFGGEETLGWLWGSHVHDKDATSVACLLAEIALKLKSEEGKTLVDYLEELYCRFGYFYEKTLSFHFQDSKEGVERQKSVMDRFRNKPPMIVGGQPVVKIADFSSQTISDLEQKKQHKIDLPISSIVILTLADESQIIIRPSGTEAKIKIYLMLHEEGIIALEESKKRLAEKATLFESDLRKIVESV